MDDQAPQRSVEDALREVRRFWGLILEKAGILKMLHASGLLLAAGVTEGLALLLLVPLLQSIDPSAGGGDGAGGRLGVLLGMLHVQLTLVSVLGLFMIVAIVRALIARQSAITILRLQLELVRNIRVDLYSAIAHASWSFLRRRHGADYQAAITSEIDRLGTAVHFALEMPSRAIMISAHIIVAFLIAPLLSLVALSTGLLIAWLVRGHLGESLRLGERLSESFMFLHRQISEFLAGLKITKSFGAEDRHVNAFTNAVDDVDKHLISYSRSSANSRVFQDIAAALAVALFLWISAGFMRLPAAEVLVLALVFHRLLPLLQGLQQQAQQVLHTSSAAFTVTQMTEQCRQAREEPHSESAPALRLEKSLSFQNVSFSHDENGKETIRDISFTLPAGSLTVVAGESGAGKSTLLDILTGLLRPDSGSIFIDGKKLGDAEVVAWRRAVAYVSQEAFLFHDTIRSNLLIARPDADNAALAVALAAAGAADFVRNFPQGIETIVGDRGSRLSGGERQRLALARALLRNPALLVLDEPTSALDSATELLVFKTIQKLKGQVTVFIVSHRPETVLGADQSLFIVNGRLSAGAQCEASI